MYFCRSRTVLDSAANIDLHRLSSPATLACRCDAGMAAEGRNVNSSTEPRIMKVRYES
jgi:hypothetical protein